MLHAAERRGTTNDDDNEARVAVRAFLDAASAGDGALVESYIRAGGDVNATLGEGWTALHGAVTRGQVRVVERLIDEASCDLNAVTAVGTSALAMALRLGNNTTTQMLLDGGASRATIAQEELRRAWDAAWLWPDVQRRLHPSWSILWTPATHHRFSRQEQAKCRLVLCINHAAAQAPQAEERHREDGASAWTSTLARLRRVLGQPREQPPQRDGSAWVYLPPAVLRLVMEYALFLW